MQVTYLRYEVFTGARSPLRIRFCIEGLFSYISESRFPSINHSNDIASTNKVVKSVSGCLEVKYVNISMIIYPPSSGS